MKIIETGSWNAYQIKDLFRLVRGTRLTQEEMVPGTLRFVSSTRYHNGVSAHIGNINPDAVHPANTITVCYNGSIGAAFYQDEPFWASDDIMVLYPRFTMDMYTGLFFCVALSKAGSKYGYSYKWTKRKMANDTILLPGTELPDYGYIHDYMAGITAKMYARYNALKTMLEP